MSMPRMKTRTANATTHPGKNAGLAPGTRRNADEMAQARADDARAQKKLKLDAKKALDKLAALEDEQQQQDAAYAATANHPPSRSSTPAGARVDDSNMDTGNPQDLIDPSDESDQYDDHSSSKADSSDSDSDSSDDNKKTQKKKKKSANSRAAVAATRQTQDASGTPAANPKKRKADDAKPSKRDKKKHKSASNKKKSGLDKSAPVGRSHGASAPSGDDDSMVAVGGPAVDDDEDEHVERPNKGKKKKGVPTPVITIQAVAPKAPTRKQLRGGSDKWRLEHLPAGTASEFTDEVVPLARELAGTLAPWVGLSVKQVQELVDRVYGDGVHEVTADGPWFGLIGYRLSDWRAGLASRGVKGINTMIEAYCESDEEDQDDLEPPTASDAPAADSSTAPTDLPAVPARAADAPPKFPLNTPGGVAAFVAWALGVHEGSGTMAFHWKSWVDSGKKKKGFFQSDLILYVFAYHLASLATIPGAYGRLEAEPIGALLLSVQAVQRALQFYRTGEYINSKKTTDHFRIDQWGDTTTQVGRRTQLVRRATKFMATVEKWDAARWTEIKVAAQEWVEEPSRRRGQTTSRSGSEAGDDELLSDAVVVVVSDSDSD